MKLVAVEKVPEINKKHKLQKMIEEFANSDAKVVKIDLEDGEYKSQAVAYQVIGVAVRRSKRPIEIHMRDGNIFLAKIS